MTTNATSSDEIKDLIVTYDPAERNVGFCALNGEEGKCTMELIDLAVKGEYAYDLRNENMYPAVADLVEEHDPYLRRARVVGIENQEMSIESVKIMAEILRAVVATKFPNCPVVFVRKQVANQWWGITVKKRENKGKNKRQLYEMRKANAMKTEMFTAANAKAIRTTFLKNDYGIKRSSSSRKRSSSSSATTTTFLPRKKFHPDAVDAAILATYVYENEAKVVESAGRDVETGRRFLPENDRESLIRLENVPIRTRPPETTTKKPVVRRPRKKTVESKKKKT